MEKYDVIIVGGGTSGIACGYIASKYGLKTLIVENNSFLGGSITSSLVIPSMKSECNINCEFINDFKSKLDKFNARITFPLNNNDFWINPELCKIVLDEMLSDVNCEVLFNTNVIGVTKEYNILSSLKIIPNVFDINFNTSSMLSLYINEKYNDNIIINENNIKVFYKIVYKILSIYINSSDKIKQINLINFDSNIKINNSDFKIAFINSSDEIYNEKLYNLNSNILSLSINSIQNNTDNIKFINIINYNLETNFVEPMCISGKQFVDASGDGVLALLAGCKNLKEENETQYPSLRFIVSNVDIIKFSQFLFTLDKDKNISPIYKIGDEIHLSTAYTNENDKWALTPYFIDAIKKGILTEEEASYFQIFTVASMKNAICFNCPRVFGSIDNLRSRSIALINARKSILNIFNFCKIYFPGFENSYISQIANSLGIRVSNRIEGEYIYTKKDMLSSKQFQNKVMNSNYPIDLHVDKKTNNNIKSYLDYSLPLESLKSKNISNLYIIGRCLSADFVSQSALRVQVPCFQMGEASAFDILNKLNKL